jgi:hypothetical protein
MLGGYDYTQPLLPQLKDSHRTAVEMSALGQKRRKIAETIDISENSLMKWHQRPWWNQAMEEARDKLMGSAIKAMTDLLPLSLEAAREILEDEESPQRAQVIAQVWKKLFSDAPSQGKREIDFNFNVTYIRASEQEQLEEAGVIESEGKLVAPASPD